MVIELSLKTFALPWKTIVAANDQTLLTVDLSIATTGVVSSRFDFSFQYLPISSVVPLPFSVIDAARINAGAADESPSEVISRLLLSSNFILVGTSIDEKIDTFMILLTMWILIENFLEETGFECNFQAFFDTKNIETFP